MNFKIISILLFLGISVVAFSQESVTGMQINEAVVFEAKKVANERKSCNCDSENEVEALQLPFFDDFSVSNIFPDQELWHGRSTFVNKDFPYMPVNIGAVTFDAIDSSGKVYSSATVAPFKADELMSQNIRLDSIFAPAVRKLSPEDSIYLSFYYQPQGVGYAPQLRDSLILEFSQYTGNIVYSHMDSITVSTELYLGPGDTIRPLDTLWAPAELGCNPDVFTITYVNVYYGDSVTVACDSVLVPEVVWNQMWYSEGLRLDEFREIHNRDMLQIMIPIVDTFYFIDKFRFRFRNYASMPNENYPNSWKSNDDTWNVDYVYLNYNRSVGDTTYRALTFSERAPSFLRNYQVMPYRQYRYSPVPNMSTEIHMYIANLDNIEHNTKYSYHVQQVAGDFAFDYYGGSCNLKPFYEVGFQVCDGCGAAHACPPVNFSFFPDINYDTTSYIIKHYISDSSDQNSIVDSAIYHQGFYNYFAYDDGTPEGGWGVDGTEGAKVAYQFTLSVTDTLWGVQMYFNRTLANANESFFDLLVWSDNNGKPGEIVYRLENQKVKWENGLYHFYPYMLDEPIILAGTFYVGWQRNGQYKLNIGFDANNDVHSKIFHMDYNEWSTATYAGALLVRPIVGSDMVLSTDELATDKDNTRIKIFPNPASTYFSIYNTELKNDPQAELKIYSTFGAEVHSQKGLDTKISIGHIPTGIYIVRIVSKNNYYTTKLLINR
ncbi:MAG: T9SS type A sorting domain-containing protein [Bacteroidota bacterium]